MKTVRLAVIGLGTMGSDLLHHAVDVPSVEIAAVCDLQENLCDKAVAVAKGAQAFASYEEAIATTQPDGVLVAVPQGLHPAVSYAALEAGSHVFCEKPMALTVEECRQMIGAAAQAQRGLMIGQVLRYMHPFMRILELARSGELGKTIGGRVIRTMPGWAGEAARPWRALRAECGGMLPEVNIHEIDFLLCLMGHPTEVFAYGGHHVNNDVDYEDLVMANIRFEGGACASVTSSCCDAHGRNSGEIFFEKGSAYYDSLTGELRIARFGVEVEVIPYGELGPDCEPGVRREVREFVEFCRGDGPLTIPGEEGLRNVAVCEAAYRSICDQQPVAVTV